MSQAAYKKVVQVSDSASGPWKTVAFTSPGLNRSGTVLDDTALINNEGFRSRIIGLLDWSVSGSANLKLPGQDGYDAQEIIQDAYDNRDIVWVRYLPAGETNLAVGFQGPARVENVNYSGDVDGLETLDISLQSTGKLERAN